MVASLYGNWELAKLLLKNGADVNATRKDGGTALIETSRRGESEELAKFLLAKGADPNARYIEDGMTPLLMWASFVGTRDVCKAMLKKGADVNARDNQGRDALMLASKRQDSELMQLLRARGASGAAQSEAKAKRLEAEAQVAKAAEVSAKWERAERAETERLEAEAVAKGELLPRLSEAEAAGKGIEGTFLAAGLTWQWEPAPRTMNLEDARSYAASLIIKGTYWRLPTVHELDALYKEKLASTGIAAYPAMENGWYWSASPYPDGNTWCVNFLDGSTAGNVLDKPIFVRCVARDIAAKDASGITGRTEGALGVADAGQQAQGTFRAAGLTWQREPARWEMNWQDAKSYAARLTLAGGGWRLPTVRELQALYQEKLSSPAIAAIPGMHKYYWSGSPTEANPTDYIWGVSFSNGEVTGAGDTRREGVRCVRQ
jgi:hypothetical protein